MSNGSDFFRLRFVLRSFPKVPRKYPSVGARDVGARNVGGRNVEWQQCNMPKPATCPERVPDPLTRLVPESERACQMLVISFGFVLSFEASPRFLEST